MQGGLVFFDDEQVIRLLLLDNVAGRLALSMQSVCCDECTCQRQRGQYFGKFGHLLAFFLNLEMGDDYCLLMQDGAEQVRRTLTGVMSAAYCLAFNGYALAC